MLTPEVSETLGRHGFSVSDVERVAEFDAMIRAKKTREKNVSAPLDFGDWTP